MGLDFSRQLQKLKNKSWARCPQLERRTVREKVVSCLAFRSSKSRLRNPWIPDPIKAGRFSKQVEFLCYEGAII
ncbi:unnamed protein product [Gemmata massiliana]|uniref:Uncharacterized protein n=1 Tax=Gemmata massiliana TaxID=1210884 RepID=A0A6P2D3Z1_9BACT|nr:unnamed protein product [Gemmata massiliana]